MRKTGKHGRPPHPGWWIIAAVSVACIAGSMTLFVMDDPAPPPAEQPASDSDAVDSTRDGTVDSELTLPETPDTTADDTKSQADDSADDATDAATDDRLELLSGVRVAIDPGHNANPETAKTELARLVDAGTGLKKACDTAGYVTPAGIAEARVMWDLAQALQNELEAVGATVIMTREDNDSIGPCIDTRSELMNTADVAISLHADKVAKPADSGFHVVYPASLRASTRANVTASKLLAQALRDAIKTDGGLIVNTTRGTDGLVQRADIAQLNLAAIPTVMVQLGNLENDTDFLLINTPEDRVRIAQALRTGLGAWAAQQ